MKWSPLRARSRMLTDVPKFSFRRLPSRLSGLVHAMATRDGLRAFEEIARIRSDPSSEPIPRPVYHRVCSLLVEHPQQLKNIFSLMQDQGLKRNEELYTLEVRSLLHAGRLEAALQLANEVAARMQLRLRTHIMIVQALCDRGDLDRALKHQDLIGEQGHDLEDVSLLMSMAALSAENGNSAAFDRQLGCLRGKPIEIGSEPLEEFRRRLLSAECSPYELKTARVGPDGVCSACGSVLSPQWLSRVEKTQLLSLLGTFPRDRCTQVVFYAPMVTQQLLPYTHVWMYLPCSPQGPKLAKPTEGRRTIYPLPSG